jgi:thioredoxin 1
MSDKIVTGTSENFYELVDSETPVLVDFWAEWCGPCKMIAPILDQVAEEYADKLTVVKVNIDQVDDIAPKFGVRGIPTLLMFKSGKVIGTKVGALSKSQLDDFIKSLI